MGWGVTLRALLWSRVTHGALTSNNIPQSFDLERELQLRCTDGKVEQSWVRAPQQSWAAWRTGKEGKTSQQLQKSTAGKKLCKNKTHGGSLITFPSLHPGAVCLAGGCTALRLPPPPPHASLGTFVGKFPV